MGFLSRCCSGKRLHLSMMGEPRGFSPVVVGFSSYNGELREPLVLPQRSPISIRVASGSWGLFPSHCRANRPHLGLCPETLCSSPVATGILGCIEGSTGCQASSRVEAKNSAVLSNCLGYLLEPTEWPKGSQASFAPVFLPGEFQGWGSLVGCHLWGLTDMTEAT